MLNKYEEFFLGHVRSKLNSYQGAMFDEIIKKLCGTTEKAKPTYNVKLASVNTGNMLVGIKLVRDFFPAYSLRDARDLFVYVKEGRGILYIGTLESEQLVAFERRMRDEGHRLYSSRVSA